MFGLRRALGMVVSRGLVPQRMSVRSLLDMSRRGFASWPEHEVLAMPKLSPTMTEGNIATWELEEGDEFGPGDVFCEVETDKAVMAFESTDEGFLAKILAPEGAAGVQLGSPVAVVVEDEDDVAAFANFTIADAGPSAGADSAPAAEEPEPEEAPAASAAETSSSSGYQPSIKFTHGAANAAPAAPAVASGDRVIASPFAKKLAAEQGIDLSLVTGTGPNGRIVADDVNNYTPAPAAAAAATAAPTESAGASPIFVPDPTGPYTDTEASSVRKTIASRLLQSKQLVPHYYLNTSVEMDNLLGFRKRLVARLEAQGKGKVSVNDFIIKASALALRDVPEVNSSWLDGGVVRAYDYVDISVAVATDGGLITPIVPRADTLGLSSISGKVRELAGKARDGSLQPNEFIGGTFTISNLGMFGVKEFSAIINPPQAAILAVGAAESAVVPELDDEGQVSFHRRTTMNATLSCDHRVVDGAVGAQWLQAFKGYMEDPETMIL